MDTQVVGEKESKFQMLPMEEIKGSKKLEGESTQDFYKRRKIEKASIKHYCRGRATHTAGQVRNDTPKLSGKAKRAIRKAKIKELKARGKNG
jgi:ribosomal protein S30